MRSFAIIALATGINAAAVDYAVSTPVDYAVSTPVASSSAVYESTSAYDVTTPIYTAYSSSSAGYEVSSVATPVASSSAKYVEYPVTSTKIVQETTFVCATPTVVTYEEKTYSVTEATTLTISSYSTVVVKTTQTPEAEKPTSKTPEAEKPTSKTPEAEKPTSEAETPVYSTSVPTIAPYPSKNATVSHTAPQGTATGYPTGTKPSTPEFTGAAAQAGVGLLAVVGALAAFL